MEMKAPDEPARLIFENVYEKENQKESKIPSFLVLFLLLETRLWNEWATKAF